MLTLRSQPGAYHKHLTFLSLDVHFFVPWRAGFSGKGTKKGGEKTKS